MSGEEEIKQLQRSPVEQEAEQTSYANQEAIGQKLWKLGNLQTIAKRIQQRNPKVKMEFLKHTATASMTFQIQQGFTKSL